MTYATLVVPLILLMFAVTDEFPKQSNGMIYDPATVSQLRQLVLQEERNFYACPPARSYQSQTFVLAEHLVFKGTENSLHQIARFLESIDSPTEAAVVFGEALALHLKQVPLVKLKNYRGEWSWHDSILGTRVELKQNINTAVVIQQASGYRLSIDGAVLRAYFVVEPVQSVSVSPKYGHMVDYVDCMVGNTPVYTGGKDANSMQMVGEETPAAARLASFLTYKDMPQIDWDTATEPETSAHFTKLKEWEAARLRWIHEERSKEGTFNPILKAAALEAINHGNGSWELEDLAAKYLSKKTALAIMRSRRVIGQCSMDDSPRRHARRIAQLAAETADWEIFLRAHLNILNDRFDRMSDGSYAWGGRKTYFRELEALELDLPGLVAGLALRVADESANHYYGSPGRLGRALAGSEEPIAVIDPILEMIGDRSLDPPNAAQLSLVILGYLTRLDKETALEHLHKIEYSGLEMPSYLIPLLHQFL